MLGHSVVSNSFTIPWIVPARLLCPWILQARILEWVAISYLRSPGKNIGVDCHTLLQGIFSTQGWNPGLVYCRQIFYCLSYREDLESP